MNRSEKRDRDATPATIVIATLLAAIAGFGTVYWSFAPSDNGRIALSTGKQGEGAATESSSGSRGDAAQGPLAGLNKGEMAAFVVRPKPEDLPDISFAGGNGETKSLSDWQGKVVLLNIWATWCVPCREEMPALDRLQSDLGGEDFDVVAINIDRGSSDKPQRFLAETGATHLPLYTDPSGRLFSRLKAIGMPTTLLLDREGREIGRLVGPADWDAPEALALIKAAIAAAAS